MMKLTQYKLENTIGAALTSGETFSTKEIRGIVRAIYVEFTNSTPASTSDRDVAIYEMNPADPDDVADALQTILSVTGIGADPSADNNVYYPKIASEDYQGTDLVYIAAGQIIPTEFLIFGHSLCLSVANAAAGDITTVYIVVEEF